MAKPKQKKTARRGNLTGYGDTVADAKADLTRKIDEALEGSYCPEFVTYKGVSALVYRELDGWHYRLVRPEDWKEGCNNVVYGTHYGTRTKAQNAAAHHILNIGPDSEAFYEDSDIPSFLTDPEARHNLIVTGRFYRAHRWARANMPEIAGDSHQLHAWASHHANDPQFAGRPGKQGENAA